MRNGRRDDTSDLSPRTHKEAVTRRLLHASDAATCGLTKTMLRTVNTDVVVIAVSTFYHLVELCLSFGSHLEYGSISISPNSWHYC